jgi:hypothetical protein
MAKQSSSALVLACDKTALVVVDMQNAFLSENGSVARAGHDISRLKMAIAPIRRLLERFRALGMPVIFTQMALHPDYRDAGLLGEANPALRELGHAVRGSYFHTYIGFAELCRLRPADFTLARCAELVRAAIGVPVLPVAVLSVRAGAGGSGCHACPTPCRRC